MSSGCFRLSLAKGPNSVGYTVTLTDPDNAIRTVVGPIDDQPGLEIAHALKRKSRNAAMEIRRAIKCAPTSAASVMMTNGVGLWAQLLGEHYESDAFPNLLECISEIVAPFEDLHDLALESSMLVDRAPTLELDHSCRALFAEILPIDLKTIEAVRGGAVPPANVLCASLLGYRCVLRRPWRRFHSQATQALSDTKFRFFVDWSLPAAAVEVELLREALGAHVADVLPRREDTKESAAACVAMRDLPLTLSGIGPEVAPAGWVQHFSCHGFTGSLLSPSRLSPACPGSVAY